MHQEIEKIVSVLPIIKQLYGTGVFMTVLDDAGTICGYSIPDGQKALFNVGDHFDDPSGGYSEVLRTGERKYNYLPKEVMGEAFEGYLVPIKDGGRVVGCLVSSYAVGERERLTEIVSEFNESAKQVDERIRQVVEGFESVFGKIEEVSKMTTKVEEDVDNTERVVSKISGNASKSNILALNASIEAARSGEHGRGFAVVAQEMGKLAKDSGTSAGEIQSQLLEVHKSIGEMVNAINDTDKVAQSFSEQIRQITSVVDHMLEMANEMEDGYAHK